MDNEINALAVEIAGTNVSTAYIYSPKNKPGSLGISHPFIVVVMKNMKRYFTMEITILDGDGIHRRFKLSNFQSKTKIRPFSTTMPMGLGCGWNQVQLNMVELVKIAYGTVYRETTRLQIHANCRIRRIYFVDRLYEEEDLPEEYRISFAKPRPAKEDKKDRRSINSKSSVNRSLNSQTSKENKPLEDGASFNGSQKGEENPRLEVRIPITEYDEDRSEQTNRDSVIDGEATATELSLSEAGENYLDGIDDGEIKEFDEEGVDENEEGDGGVEEKEEEVEEMGQNDEEIDEEMDGENNGDGEVDESEEKKEEVSQNEEEINRENNEDGEVDEGEEEREESGQKEENIEEVGGESDDNSMEEEMNEMDDMENKEEIIKNLDEESIKEINLDDESDDGEKEELSKAETKSELQEVDKNYEYQESY